jgi:hypothetical protein
VNRNQRVEKFVVTFEIELYGASASEALARACELQLRVVENVRRKGIAEALRQAPPAITDGFGGIEGAPHGLELDGWRCLYSIRRP